MSKDISGLLSASVNLNFPHETLETVTYSGVNGGVPITGSFVEQSDGSTWIQDNTFYFTEVSESSKGVTLFDASRGVTIQMDFKTDDLFVSFGSTTLDWTVTGVTHHHPDLFI